jgi:hypothetical protein
MKTIIALSVAGTIGLSGLGYSVPYSQYKKQAETSQQDHPNVQQATVKEVLSGAGYSYLKLQTSNGQVWAAVREQAYEPGDEVAYSGPMMMENFYSKSLNRKFEKILVITQMKKMKPTNKAF